MLIIQRLPTRSGSFTRQKCPVKWNNESKTKPYPRLVELFRRETGDGFSGKCWLKSGRAHFGLARLVRKSGGLPVVGCLVMNWEARSKPDACSAAWTTGHPTHLPGADSEAHCRQCSLSCYACLWRLWGLCQIRMRPGSKIPKSFTKSALSGR